MPIKITKKIKNPKRLNNGIKRKRRFTRRTRNMIYKALRSGLPIGKAMELSGLDRSTYYRWLEKGKSIQFPVHQRFRNTIMEIKAEIEIEKLKDIHQAAQGN